MTSTLSGFLDDYWFIIVLTIGLMFIRYEGKRRWRNAQIVTEASFIYGAYLFYFLVRGLVKDQVTVARENAHHLIEVERTLGLFIEHDLQQWALSHQLVIDFVNWVYVWLHWPVLVIVLVWLFLHRQEWYPTYRNAFLISGAIALLIFAFYPVAPPRFLPDIGIIDTIEQHSYSQHVLLPSGLANKYAAMPSLHVGWNLLASIAIIRHARASWWRAVGFVLPFIMFASVVLTGNHFIIDGIVGDLIILAGLGIALLVTERTAEPAREEPSEAIVAS